MTLAYQEYYTVKDYTLWEGEWELIDGMPYAMAPSPTVTHQAVASNVTAQLSGKIQSNHSQPCDDCIALMETDWQISNDTIVRPDVMLICKTIKEKVLVTPELIVEVVSESSTKRDELMKFELYQQEGVLYYILAYPGQRLAKVYRNEATGFKKLGDYSTETITFHLGECPIDISFAAIWR